MPGMSGWKRTIRRSDVKPCKLWFSGNYSTSEIYFEQIGLYIFKKQSYLSVIENASKEDAMTIVLINPPFGWTLLRRAMSCAS